MAAETASVANDEGWVTIIGFYRRIRRKRSRGHYGMLPHTLCCVYSMLCLCGDACVGSVHCEAVTQYLVFAALCISRWSTSTAGCNLSIRACEVCCVCMCVCVCVALHDTDVARVYSQYGFVNHALELLVLRNYGPEVWEDIKWVHIWILCLLMVPGSDWGQPQHNTEIYTQADLRQASQLPLCQWQGVSRSWHLLSLEWLTFILYRLPPTPREHEHTTVRTSSHRTSSVRRQQPEILSRLNI